MKLRAIFHLVTSYLLGQGSLFLAYSYLAADAQFDRIWHLTVFMNAIALAAGVLDWGTSFLAPRDVQETGSEAIAVSNALKLTTAALIVVSGICVSPLLPGYYRAALYMAIPGLLAFSFNLNGIFDSPERPSIHKLLLALPYLLISVCAVVCPRESAESVVGAFVGAAFSLGTLVLVFAQNLEYRPRTLLNYRWAQMRHRVHLGWRFQVSLLATQCSALAINSLAGRVFGASAGGALAYARSLIVAAVQAGQIARRVEVHRQDWARRSNVRLLLRYPIVSLVALLAPLASVLAYLVCRALDLQTHLESPLMIGIAGFGVIVPLAISVSLYSYDLMLRQVQNRLYVLDIFLSVATIGLFLGVHERAGLAAYFATDLFYFFAKGLILMMLGGVNGRLR